MLHRTTSSYCTYILLPGAVCHLFCIFSYCKSAFPIGTELHGQSFTVCNLPGAPLFAGKVSLPGACVWVQFLYSLALPFMNEPVVVPLFLGFPTWCMGGRNWPVFYCYTVLSFCDMWLQYSTQQKTFWRMLSVPVSFSFKAVWQAPCIAPYLSFGRHTSSIIILQILLDPLHLCTTNYDIKVYPVYEVCWCFAFPFPYVI